MTDDIFFLRQLGLLDHRKLPPVTLVGCGSIGSAVALMLAKMGARRFRLYDFDEVRHHNVSNTMVPRESLDRPKVEVVAEEIRRYSPHTRLRIRTHGRFTRRSRVEGIVIAAVDSNEARKVIWEVVKRRLPEFYIDARMGGEALRIYAVDPKMGAEQRLYEPSLEQGEYPLPCTAQTIIYNLQLVSAVVGSVIRRLVSGIKVPWLVVGDSLNLKLMEMSED